MYAVDGIVWMDARWYDGGAPGIYHAPPPHPLPYLHSTIVKVLRNSANMAPFHFIVQKEPQLSGKCATVASLKSCARVTRIYPRENVICNRPDSSIYKLLKTIGKGKVNFYACYPWHEVWHGLAGWTTPAETISMGIAASNPKNRLFDHSCCRGQLTFCFPATRFAVDVPLPFVCSITGASWLA